MKQLSLALVADRNAHREPDLRPTRCDGFLAKLDQRVPSPARCEVIERRHRLAVGRPRWMMDFDKSSTVAFSLKSGCLRGAALAGRHAVADVLMQSRQAFLPDARVSALTQRELAWKPKHPMPSGGPAVATQDRAVVAVIAVPEEGLARACRSDAGSHTPVSQSLYGQMGDTQGMTAASAAP